MLWLIFGIAVLVAFALPALCGKEPIPACVAAGLSFGTAVFGLGNLFGGFGVGEYEKHTAHTADMLAITTFTGQDAHLNGSFFILSGTLSSDNGTYAGYRYYTRDDQDRISLNERAAYDAYLIEDGKAVAVTDTCELVSNEPNKWFALFGNTNPGYGYCNDRPAELHIPAGSVTTEVNVPLPH